MENIIYIDDYINIYNKKNKQVLVINPYKNTLKNGLIIDKEKFLKKINTIKKTDLLKESLFEETILVVITNLYNKDSKNIIKSVLEELNYKNIKYINELDYLKINKDILFINYNYGYFYFIYTNNFGNNEIILYENNKINKNLIISIIKEINKKNVFIYGKNYKELVNLLSNTSINYYYFENSDNLIINIMLNEKKM